MAYNPAPPFNPNVPVPHSTNDREQKPYVGKPKPMPTPAPQMPPGTGQPQRPLPPRYGSSDGSNFSLQNWLSGRRGPHVNVLPGQGQGPMPVGTRPLPSPVVKDTRGGGWDPRSANDPFYRGTRFPSPEEIAQHEADRAAGRLGGPTSDTGDNRLDRGVIRDASIRHYPGDLGVIRVGAGLGGGPDMMWQRPPGWDGEGVDSGFAGPKGNAVAPDGKGGFISVGAGWGGGMQGMKPGGGMGPGGPRMGGWNNQLVEGTPEYGDWVRRMKLQHGEGWTPDGGVGAGPSYGGPNQARDFNVPNYGAPVQRGPGAPGMPSGGAPPQSPQLGGGGRQPLRPGMEYRPRGGQRQVNQRAMQQGAQALYNDNTIPHEFKGQLLQAAQSGNAQAFNEMLFNSGMPHEMKLRLQQLFGYGDGQGAPAAPQASTPDQGVNQAPPQQDWRNRVRQGSGYYGAY